MGESFTFATVTLRVIGVAGDVRSARLDSIGGYAAYVPDRMMPRSAMALVVRTTGDPAQLAEPVRRAIRELNPRQAFEEVVPFTTKLSEAASTQRFFTVLVAIFGALALVLAAVGLYGVVSYTVRQREREMAVRLALGAPPSRVTSLMLRQGMTPVVVGLVVGLLARGGLHARASVAVVRGERLRPGDVRGGVRAAGGRGADRVVGAGEKGGPRGAGDCLEGSEGNRDYSVRSTRYSIWSWPLQTLSPFQASNEQAGPALAPRISTL